MLHNALFHGALRENRGLSDLSGDNSKHLFEVDMGVQFDKNGNFAGVKKGQHKFTIDQWNQKGKEDFKK